MRLTYWGHSCFLLETGSHRIVIDPFLTGNTHAPVKAADVSCDFLLCSHGHDDHVGDAAAIAKACGATIVGPYELCEWFAGKGVKTDGLNPGGGAAYPFGRVKLTLAHHSSSTVEQGGKQITYLGNPCGILIEAEGKRVYHAGDTALFLDMQLIGKGGLDLAMLPIGDRYTMGPADAIDALDLLKPRQAVPMHFNTWPPIRQDGPAFAREAARRGHAVSVLAPGESITV